jgi:PhnB protein
MKALVSYLYFNGNTEEAFSFYKDVFGGEFANIQRYKNIPGSDRFPAADQEKIMHIGLKLPNGQMLLGSDVISQRPPVVFGSNFSLVAMTESKEESDRIFAKLADGGKVLMQLDNTFWGAYYGIVADRFGVEWMVEYIPNQS